jgi:hypothetical protein
MKKLISLVFLLIGAFLIYWVITLAGAEMSNYSYGDNVPISVARQNQFGIVLGTMKVTDYDGNKGTAELYCQSADKTAAFTMKLTSSDGKTDWKVVSQKIAYQKGTKEFNLVMPYWWHKLAYGMGDAE